MIVDKEDEGYQVDGLVEDLAATPDDYQRLYALGVKINAAPLRHDWSFVEPNALEEIHAEQAHAGVGASGNHLPLGELQERARAGFLGSVAGCILGKPVEIMGDLAELRNALSKVGDWPLNDYISERLVRDGGLREFNHDWPETVRENIHFVAADDDINYTLLGLMTLEKYGRDFTKADLRRMWVENIVLGYAWGPEKGFLAKQALAMAFEDDPEQDLEVLMDTFNPLEEYCGAMIRADAYGYAALGHPDIASDLAWRDASLTHRKTGVYATMFAAAAIAAAATAKDPLDIFETALAYVPQRSRFHAVASDSLAIVWESSSWVDAYDAIHGRYGDYGHCRIFQEIGTLMNTARFAEDVGHGICLQVSQGNDTDSFGDTAGAILGVWFGPGHLEERWITPFNDTLQTRLAGYYESSLAATADRIAALPALTNS
jgi:ADP-ribosylglycohydrolase